MGSDKNAARVQAARAKRRGIVNKNNANRKYKGKTLGSATGTVRATGGAAGKERRMVGLKRRKK